MHKSPCSVTLGALAKRRRHALPRSRRSTKPFWVTAAATVTLVAASCQMSTATAAPKPGPASKSGAAVVAVMNGPYGPMLVAGSGPSVGTALYLITSDRGTSFGCSTAKQEVAGSPYVCTGPMGGKAEWPAYTSKGAPVAGAGVKQSLLGEVDRPGIGEQVTYAGHPLYLFDEIPGLPTGEGWDEPSLPADHGSWYLVSPKGNPMGWEGTLTTVSVKGHEVLAELMLDGGGWVPFPVYAYSGGTSCAGPCAAEFNPVYAIGSPGLSPGLPGGHAGLVSRADGTQQRTWDGKALYLYADETVQPSGSGLVLGGSGDGVSATGGGTFSLVSP
jgi:predicted lipoprotein with Yx(FWY)xxD motif